MQMRWKLYDAGSFTSNRPAISGQWSQKARMKEVNYSENVQISRENPEGIYKMPCTTWQCFIANNYPKLRKLFQVRCAK